jgi:hypothetical protein
VIWQVSAGEVILILDLGNVVKEALRGNWIIGEYPPTSLGRAPGLVVIRRLQVLRFAQVTRVLGVALFHPSLRSGWGTRFGAIARRELPDGSRVVPLYLLVGRQGLWLIQALSKPNAHHFEEEMYPKSGNRAARQCGHDSGPSRFGVRNEDPPQGPSST